MLEGAARLVLARTLPGCHGYQGQDEGGRGFFRQAHRCSML